MKKIPVSLCLLLVLICTAQGQEVPTDQAKLLDSLLRGHSYAIDYVNNKLEGPGLELLLAGAKDAQFVVLGEQHLTVEIPLFTSALFQALHDHYRYNYVALEEGPLLGKALSAPENRGLLTQVQEYVQQFPNAVHMLTESEVKMFADVGAISQAKSHPLWGVNQAFGAAHILDQLVKNAPNPMAKSQAKNLLEEALEYEGERFAKNVSYLTEIANQSEFDGLYEALGTSENKDLEFLINTLLISHNIFAPYAADANPEPGAFFNSGRKREEYMKTMFTQHYQQALAHGDTLPKVLVKSGNVHVRRGLTPGLKIPSFGSFLSELARFNGQQTLFISAHIYNDSSVYRIPGDSWFRPIAEAADPSKWTLFDLRPLQHWFRSRRLTGLPQQLLDLMQGFDVILVIGNGDQGTIEPFRTKNFHWFPGSQ